MTKKLFEKIVSAGYARTNRFEYRVIGREIWKRPCVDGGAWVFDRRIYGTSW